MNRSKIFTIFLIFSLITALIVLIGLFLLIGTNPTFGTVLIYLVALASSILNVFLFAHLNSMQSAMLIMKKLLIKKKIFTEHDITWEEYHSDEEE